MKTQLTKESKLILVRVSRCQNISITRAPLRRTINHRVAAIQNRTLQYRPANMTKTFVIYREELLVVLYLWMLHFSKCCHGIYMELFEELCYNSKEINHAISGHWLSCTGCWEYLFRKKWLIYFMHLSTSYNASVDGIFSNNRLNKLSWTPYISNIHIKQRIIGRTVPGLATDSPWGVWGRIWTICLLYGGPLLGLCL